jgi:uncharacterized damage-inducible protein DinB
MSGSSQKEAVAYGRPLVLSRGGPARPQAKRRRSFKPKPLDDSDTENEENTMNLYGPKQLADSMRTVRKNTILIAEDIPEKDYSYRPTPESRSVGEVLVHIASLALFDRLVHEEQHLSSLEGFDFGTAIKKSETQEGLSRSKAEIIERLRTEGERWSRWVEQLSDDLLEEQVWMPGGISKNRFEMLLGTKEHEIQHRAQLTVIERLLGIVPHLTRNRQAASAVAAKRAS